MKIEILDKGFIELLSVAPHLQGDYTLEQHIANTARTSFLGDSKGYEQDVKLMRYLWTHKHFTPFEFVTFQLRVKAPMIIWWQWVRHRTMSYNLQSGRYTPFLDEFYIPSAWRSQSAFNKQASGDDLPEPKQSQARAIYDDAIDAVFRAYEALLSLGVAKEQARLVIPSSIYYTGMVSVNLRNLLHFLELRTAKDAQYEIRVYADAIQAMLKPMFPNLFELIEGE